MKPEIVMRTFIDEAFNKGNLSVLEAAIHPEYRYWSPDSEMRGIGQLTEFIQMFRSAFPDLAVTIDDFFCSEDRSCTAVTIRGTHEQDFMGIAATQKSVNVQAVIMSRFEGGKIIEEKEIIDNLTFFQQLGVLPETE